jgi:hypothetical protein
LIDSYLYFYFFWALLQKQKLHLTLNIADAVAISPVLDSAPGTELALSCVTASFVPGSREKTA